MSVAGQGTQTSSLLAQEHRDMKIKVENTAAQEGKKTIGKKGVTDERLFWYVFTVA